MGRPTDPAPIEPQRAAELDRLVERARRAADAFRRLDQPAVDRIVRAMVVAGLEAATPLARIAIEETGFGVFEDKVVKNLVATEFLYDYLKERKTVGVIREEPERNLRYVAEPVGVVMAILPVTNPTSTALFKGIVAAKTRNAILFRPSPRGIRCAQAVSCDAAAGVHTNSCRRSGLSLMPVTLYGPSMLPVRSRGVALAGLCASRLSRRTGCQTFCSRPGSSTNVNPTSCTPAVTLMRGDTMRLSTSSREMVMFLPLDS